jgi:uncharacterized CHY-type Zn-finger protein
MQDRFKKAGMTCPKCYYELLVDTYNNVVFCQKCEKRILPKFRLEADLDFTRKA